MRTIVEIGSSVTGVLIAYLTGLIISIVVAVPVYFLWNAMVPVYFSFLPTVWHAVPYWHVVALVWLVSLLASLFRKE